MTKLIRAADTLGRHYKQDYGEMTGELASLQPHASPCVEVQSLVGKAKRGNVDTQEKPTGV